MLNMTCPECSQPIKFKPELIGKRGTCPKCRAKVELRTGPSRIDHDSDQDAADTGWTMEPNDSRPSPTVEPRSTTVRTVAKRSEPSTKPTIPDRYFALPGIARIYIVFGLLVIVASFALPAVAILKETVPLAHGLAALGIGVFVGIGLLATGELLDVALSIEKNVRRLSEAADDR